MSEILKFVPPPSATARVLPHSLEMEAVVLCCCCIDGAVLTQCATRNLHPHSFYDPQNGAIFTALLALAARGDALTEDLVYQELKDTGKLALAGGIAHLTEVTTARPSTMEAAPAIAKVMECATRREMILAATSAVERVYDPTEDVQEIVSDHQARLESLGRALAPPSLIRTLDTFVLPDEDDPTCLLGRNRYIGRGDGVLLISSSGMGKSVMAMQWAVLCALARPFLGIECKRPLTSLVVQSEDSDGDIAEVWYSLKVALHLTDLEVATVNARVHVVRDTENRGDDFINSLRPLIERIKPDLVWINPLHAYAGCDIADAREMGNFLRGGLNRLNRDLRFAWMIIHHTPKPITGKKVPDRQWHEVMYAAAGSAELPNWSRAGLLLKPTEEQGQFNLILTKRGPRAEVTMEVPGAEGQMPRLELTCKIPIQHSTQTVMVKDWKRPFRIIHWVTRDPDPDNEKKGMSRPGQFEESWSDLELLQGFPPSTEAGDKGAAIFRSAMATDLHEPMGRKNFYPRARQMKKEGLVEQTPVKLWRRTKKGDELIAEHERNSP